MKKLLLIINPRAGKLKAKSALLDIITILGKSYLVCVRVTEYRGHATELAREAGDYDLLVCSGGDGTLNEVIAGVLSGGLSIPIGYIPSGTTNDFAATLGLPTDPVKAAQLILKGEAQPFDIGRFDERYFTYIASFGMFANVSYDTPQNLKNSLGHLAYLLEGVKGLHEIHAEHLKIETDDTVFEDDFLFGAVSNSTSIGGVITLKPTLVDMRDGRFELLLIRMPKNLVQLHSCVRALSAQSYNNDSIIFTNTKNLRVTSDQALDWSLDGEKATMGQVVDIRNLHRAVRVLTPKAPAAKE